MSGDVRRRAQPALDRPRHPDAPPGRLHELDGPLLPASDASSFIAGQALVVDGGRTSR